MNQYSQAVGDTAYNNWHPVLHTLLFYTLPLKLINHFGFIVFLQLLYFCLAFTYLILVMYQTGCPKVLLIVSYIYVWLNPYLITCMMTPMKDIAMLIFSVLLIAYYIRIICSKGAWLRKKRNLILFTLASVLCLYMRYNALFFVAPIIAMALFYAVKDKKIRLHAIMLLLIFFASVRVLYFCLDVEQPTQRTVEAIGLPVSIWCNVMKETPDVLPTEAQDFMYSIASQETYDSFYVGTGFNSVKWAGMDLDLLDTISWSDVLKYTFQCFRCAPRQSLEAVARLTDFVWGIEMKDEPFTIFVAENQWGISSNSSPKAALFVLQIETIFTYSPLDILFGSYGLGLLVLLVIALVLFAGNRMSAFHILPLFIYDFGTMLLLSGRDSRFFLFNLPLWLPMIFLLIRDETPFTNSSKRSPVECIEE
ncbi:MAG: hypothetical protein LUE16_05810 [Lachnospiraceae bacterium]|nr:hypothetical protein [Lachnospiraceae bacterium]